jgi:hypothetical protein
MDPVQPAGVDRRLVPELLTLYEFAGELTTNALYMRNELGNLPDPPEVKARIARLCDSLLGVAYDLRKEVPNLEYKLALGAGEKSRDPDITNPDPRVTLDLIRALPEEVLFDELMIVLRSLQPDDEPSVRHPLSYILVLESGSNMLKAHARAAEAIDRIEAILPRSASGQ